MDQLNFFPNKITTILSLLTSVEHLESNTYSLTFDLTNEYLIKKDNDLYSEQDEENHKDINFKDYLYAYFLKIEVAIDTYCVGFQQMHNKGIYSCTLIPAKEYNQLKHGADIYKGTVFYAGDSIKQRSYYIMWSEQCLDIYVPNTKLPFISSTSEMSVLLNNTMDKINIKTFHVLDVGQASSNIVNYEDGSGAEKYLFYDVGITLDSTRDPDYSRYVGLYESISYEIFSAIIISHWHEDHFLGIFLDKSGEIFKKAWVVPDCTDTWNAKRLCYINYMIGNLIMIDNCLKGLLYENTNMSLYKGEQLHTEPIGYKNGSGLYLYFKKGSDNLLALGDVPYVHAKSLLNKANRSTLQVDTLIVPNHGSVLKNNFIQPRLSMKTAGFDISNAVISAGVTSPKSPNYETLSELFAKGFNTLRTDVECKIFSEKDITIEF